MTATPEQLEHRALLVAALRSGRFDQVRGRLRRNDQYCCLGVGCEVFHDVSGDGAWTDRNDGVESFSTMSSIGPHSSWSQMPYPVAEWYGFSQEQQTKLADLNDVSKAGFDVIASEIERMP